MAYCRGNRVIGAGGKLPWSRLEGDLPRFRALTLDQAVVMGRKTWESLPAAGDGSRMLPRRTNLVVSRNPDLRSHERPGLFFFESLEDAVARCRWHAQGVFLIGGEGIYRESLRLDLADEIIASEVHRDYEGDARFPSLGPGWTRTLLSGFPGYDLVRYRRRRD